MNDTVIDLATWHALQESAGGEFVAELAGTFLEEGPRMLDSLGAALAVGDTETFRRTAHSLKSNCLTFGALGMGAMARELEHGSVKLVEAGDVRVLDALAGEYARVAAALEALRHA